MTATGRSRQLPRGAVWTGVTVLGLLGLGVLTIRLVGPDPGQRAAGLWSGLALTALPLMPAGLAVLALRRGDQVLLAVATGLVLIVSFPMATLAPIALLALVAWAWALARWPGDTPQERIAVGSLVLAGLASLGAVTSLFIHVDPYCWQQTRTLSGDISTRVVAPDGQSGFVWNIDTTSASGTRIASSDDVLAAGCGSDQIVPAEAATSLALTLGAAWLASRVPRGGHDRTGTVPVDGPRRH